jgi:hypothetical protein
VDIGVLTHGNAGDMACGHTEGTNAAPTAVVAGKILCAFGAWGQYDGTRGHYSDLTAGMDVQATGGWTVASWPTNVLLSTTPEGSTTKTLRFTLGAGLYASGLARAVGPAGGGDHRRAGPGMAPAADDARLCPRRRQGDARSCL